jgi:hypothetical protein
MASGQSVKVFFEPKIEPHDPDLYAYQGVAHGIAAADATAALIREQFDEQGFVLLCGLIPSDKIGAARNALGAMTLSDQPECEMIWYEGGLRDHLALSGDDDQETNGSSAADGFVLGQEGDRLPALEPRLRARFVRKFMGFVAGNPGLAELAHDPAIVEIVTDLVGGPPRLFQDMALIKPPDGREKPWHQDHAYFNLPLDTPIVGVWSRLAPPRRPMVACTFWPAAIGWGHGRISSAGTGRSVTRMWRDSGDWPCRCSPATSFCSTASCRMGRL